MHPRYLVDAQTRMIVELWHRQRGAGGSGVALPLAGGLLDQPSYLVHAFGYASAVWSRLEAARLDRERSRRG